jgi:photosystem II stability/assembly factor-like uncharacterized protein
MYAGTFGDGVYRSLDGGESWEPWSEGLPEESQVWSLRFTLDGTLFVGIRYEGTNEGTYKRAESRRWQRTNFPYGALALEVDSQTGAIYAGTRDYGLYRDKKGRDESRQDWQNLGLPLPRRGPTRSIVWAVAPDPDDAGIIYVGTNGDGVYKSTDGGMTWVQKNDGLESWMGLQTGIEHALDIRDILISRTQPGVVYVATWGAEGIYRSNDDGENWEPQLVDEPDPALIGKSVYVRALAETETDIFAGTEGGVFRLSDPDDIFWQPTGLKGEQVRALLSDPHYPQTLYAATLEHGIYKSVDNGETWEPKNVGLESEVAQKVNALPDL